MASNWPQPAGAAGVGSQGGAAGSPVANSPKRSDQRFRSFCERYFVARATFFRQDPIGLAEDTWSCILDAKRAYAMIKYQGFQIEPGDSEF